jgi:glycine cleavage system H lipoate-binding protein
MRSQDVVVIGITDFGQRSLGDLLSATLLKVGDQVGAAPRWAGSIATAGHSTSCHP